MNQLVIPSNLDRYFEDSADRWLLSNGLTVLFKEDHSSELASVQVWVKSGSIHEEEWLGCGISHFLEHMLFKGTEHRSGQQLSQEVQAAGGYFNAYTTFDRTVYYIDLPSERIELSMEVLSDMVFHSLLPAKEIEKERDVILREIDMYLDDPISEASQALFAKVFRQHPYQYPVIGFSDPFKSLNPDDLHAYYRARYVPNNIVLVVVGDVERQRFSDLVDQYFADHPRQRIAPILVQEEPRQLSKRTEHLQRDVNVCHGELAFRIPPLDHPDAPLLDLIASAMGSGNSSILWQKLREQRQLVHHIDASCWNPGTAGLFCISFLCDLDKRIVVEKAIEEEIQSIVQKGIEPQSVAKAIRQILVAEINTRKTMSSLASRYGFAEVVIGDMNYPQRYFRRLSEVDAETLTPIMERTFVEDQLTVVSLNAHTESSSNTSKKEKKSISGLNPFKVHALENGVRLLVQHDPRLPKIHVRVAHLGGPCYEAPNQRGITNLAATMLLRETKQRSAVEVAEAIEALGATLGQFSGNNAFGLYLEVLSQDFNEGVECLRQSLLEPLFTKERFEIERLSQIAQIKEMQDEIVHYGTIKLRQLFFGEHPFSIPPEGTEEQLNSLDASTLREHCQRLILGNNTVVAISGDFNPNKDLSHLESVLEQLPKGVFQEQKPTFTRPAEVGAHETKLPREQAVVFEAYPSSGMTGKDFIVSEVLNELFSDMSGQLFAEVREKRGLAYFVGASRLIGCDNSMFYLYAGTYPKGAEAVFEQMAAELERIRSGKVTEEELRRCQTHLRSQRRMKLQTADSRTTEACLNTLYGLPTNQWMTYDKDLEAVTLDSLQEFAQKYFCEEKRVRLTVKP